ncbi:MAG: tetratricopeptide repeat protein [Candidatus Zixiibacteriota bacterium]
MKKQRGESPTKPQLTDSFWERTFQLVFLPVLLLLVIIHLLAIYWGTPFLWGVHHLHFFPRWLGWILSMVTLSLFVPAVNKPALNFLETIFSALGQLLSKMPKYPAFIAAGIVSMPVFWLLRTEFFLLGDGCFKLEALASGGITTTEPLDGIIHHQLYRLLTPLFSNADPSLSYTIPSVICGGAFIFLILALTDILGKTSFQKILIFSALVTLGSIQLFFGYVESYTTLLIGLTLFLLFSVLFLKGKIGIVFPFLALVLSMALHVSALALIPAFLYLIFRKWQTQGSRFLDVPTAVCMVACLGIVFLGLWKASLVVGKGRTFGQFLPLVATPKMSFTMFSRAHLSEFANELLLISPAGTLLFLFFLLRALKLKSFSHPTLNFLLISGLSGLLLVFAYDCHWGSMDWDLMSFPGIFIALFGILSFLRWRGQWSKVKNYGLILIAVSLFHTVPWILVNADGARSVDRYVMTATHDVHLLSATGGGMWRVGRILDLAGLTQKAEEILKLGIERNPNEMGCYSYLGDMLHDQNRDEEAVIYLEKALQLRPQSPELRFSLGKAYLSTDLETAIFHLAAVKSHFEHEPAFVIGLARAYLKAERPEDAKNLVQGFLARGEETATMRGLLGASFFLLRDSTRARAEWERAQELNPDEPLAKAGLERLREMAEK